MKTDFKTKRQIVSSRNEFQVHDHSDDAFTYYCNPKCPGHDVRQLDCDHVKDAKAIAYQDKLDEARELHAEAEAELEAERVRDEAEDRYLDQLDSMGGNR